jgi:hypothetical protein
MNCKDKKSTYVGYDYLLALIKHTFSFSFLMLIIQAIRVTNFGICIKRMWFYKQRSKKRLCDNYSSRLVASLIYNSNSLT